MSFKENLKKKIELDELADKIRTTMREIPGERKLNKKAVHELLQNTDFKYMRVRDLNLYVRSLEGDKEEVVVLDNELPIYHTSVADVAMRKTPYWKEMLSIRNVKRILNDQDVVTSKGKASLQRIHAIAVEQLDLSYTREDIASMVEEGRLNLEKKSSDAVEESLFLFFELLGFQAVYLGLPDQEFSAFARPKASDGSRQLYEDLVLFDAASLQIHLLKGNFTPKSDLDMARLLKCLRGEKAPDLQGAEVIEYLGKLAMEGGQEHSSPAVSTSL